VSFHGHHDAPAPVQIKSDIANGIIEIAATPAGERLRFTVLDDAPGLACVVTINRGGFEREVLPLQPLAGSLRVFLSAAAPAEPHSFTATLDLELKGVVRSLPFGMTEPENHHH
jgi:hypothetical protein